MINGTPTEKTQVILGILVLRAELTNILWGAQDLPDFCDVVHTPGQAKVHNTNIPQRFGTRQQDVLWLESTDAQIRQRLLT